MVSGPSPIASNALGQTGVKAPWFGHFSRVLLIGVAVLCLFIARGFLPHPAEQPIKNPLAVPTEPMPSWAKLYPNAVPDSEDVDTTKLLRLTTWDTPYTVKATPAQIDAFYREVAADEGFTEVRNIGGNHFFENASEDTKFSYMIFADGDRQRVLFQARTFDKPAAATGAPR